MFFNNKFDIAKDVNYLALEQKVKNLELQIEMMKTNLASLRGLMNRKLGNVEETQTEKNKNPSIFLTPNGLPI
jgi:hypothetical protein